MSKMSRRAKELKSMGDHDKFLKRIQKTLYYSKLPPTDRLSWPVTELAADLFSEPRNGHSLERLQCKDAAHITRETCVSPCSFVLAMLYLERLKSSDPEYLQCVAPSQLFLVSLMISSKFLYDAGEDSEVIMSEWACSGGLSVQELIDSEKAFLNAIQWNIYVNEESFWKKMHALEAIIAKREGNSRGYFTYTELHSLLQTFDLHLLISTVASIIAVLLTTYTAGILTIFGSMMIASHIPGHLLHQPSTSAINLNEITADTNETSLWKHLQHRRSKSLSVVDVLQTSILLASLQTEQLHQDLNNHSNKEDISWDWWNSPSMTWLTHASRMAVETIKWFAVPKFANDRFIDTTMANIKLIALEDKLHKGTKIRIQDQLEGTWHTEWKDSLSHYDHIAHFLHDLKR